MLEILLIIGISIFASISSIISTGDIYKKQNNIFKSITYKGWLIIALNLGIITFSIIQYMGNEKKLDLKELSAKEEQQKRDSTLKAKYDIALLEMKNKFDSSNINVIATVSNVLGKYGYKLDSTNMSLVELIRDSTNNTLIEESAPILKLSHINGIDLQKIENNRCYFKLTMCSYDAGSTGYECKFHLIMEDSLKNLALGKTLELLRYNERISKNGILEVYFDFPITYLYKYFYIILKGSYYNMDKTKKYYVNDTYFYNKSGNQSGGLLGDSEKRINDVINN